MFKQIITSNRLIERLYRRYRRWKKRKPYRNLSNEDVFTKIYTSKAWGGSDLDFAGFYSGKGSYGSAAEDYINLINEFITANNISSITDVGCGDFSIGKKITDQNSSLKYNGCDVVKKLIESHNSAFATDRITFFQLDAAKDVLPAADLLTVREVLQHLNNSDIKKILDKIKSFRFVIITENLLADKLVKKYNKDKPAGPDIRLAELSGVYIDKPPFNKTATEILSCRSDAFGMEAYLKTYLIKNE